MDTEKELKEVKERLDKVEKEIADIKANYLSTEHFRQTLGLNEKIDFAKNPCLHQ